MRDKGSGGQVRRECHRSRYPASEIKIRHTLCHRRGGSPLSDQSAKEPAFFTALYYRIIERRPLRDGPKPGLSGGELPRPNELIPRFGNPLVCAFHVVRKRRQVSHLPTGARLALPVEVE